MKIFPSSGAVAVTLIGASVVMAGCAPQTPATIVDGYGQRKQVVVSKANTSTAASKAAVHSRVASTKAVVQATPQVASQDTAKAVQPASETVEHRVVASDSIYKLARTYNTTTDRILKDNDMASVTDIQEGQTLRIASNTKPQVSAWDDMKKMLTERRPETPQTQVAAAPDVTDSAEPQVTEKPVEKVVERPVALAATVPSIKALAAIEPAAGERPKAVDDVNYTTYVVQPKETIYRISLKYNVSVLDIMAANDFEQPQDLKANAKIRVPVKHSVAEQIATKAATDVAPAAGEEKAEVAAENVAKPVQVAMLTPAQKIRDDLDSKAVQQQAFKDAVLPAVKEKPVSKNDEQKAEQQRGKIDEVAAHAKGLVWPVKGQILRRFGDDGNGVARTGINIAVPKGTSVLASEDGTVLYADDGLKIYGKMVLLRHDNGMVSAYAHNGYLLVRKNERVRKGQVIALSGATGNVESPQLHFELRQHASAIDPMRVLPSL